MCSVAEASREKLFLPASMEVEPASEPASMEATSEPASSMAATTPVEDLVADTIGLNTEVLGGTARFNGNLASRLQMDTAFNSTGEDVFEFRNRALLSLDYRMQNKLRVYVQGRFDWFVVGGQPKRATFAFFNAANPRWDYLVDLREAFVDIYTRYVDIRIGNQIFTWGQNEGVSPLDALNPFDARDVLQPSELFKIAVPSVQATFALGEKGSARLVWIPFYIPNRFNVYGQDFSALTPGSPAYNQVGDISRTIDPSLDPRINNALVATKLPSASPASSTLGLRVQYQLGPVDLALVGIFGWNRVPRVKIDPDLRTALQSQILGNPGQVPNDPALRDTLLRLQQKTQLGISLAEATYERTGVVGFDIGATVEDFTFKGDFGWSPNVTLFNDLFEPVQKHTLRSALGVEYRYGDILQAAVTWHSNAVLGVEPGVRLAFIEPRYASAAKARNVFYMGFVGLVRLSVLDDRLKLSVSAAYNPLLADFTLIGNAGWHFTEAHSLTATAMFFEGPQGTPFGYFTRNDQVALEYRYAF